MPRVTGEHPWVAVGERQIEEVPLGSVAQAVIVLDGPAEATCQPITNEPLLSIPHVFTDRVFVR